jgi:hypothetical protein
MAENGSPQKCLWAVCQHIQVLVGIMSLHVWGSESVGGGCDHDGL